MDKKAIPFIERFPILFGISLLGGFLDAYTYVTRDGILCTMHTGNMAKLGFSLAEGNWSKALGYLIPILACVLGSTTIEAIKDHTPNGRDWRKISLIIEIIALILVGFVPVGVASVWITTAIAYISGLQMCIFRTSPWGDINSTFSTGNLRAVGQFLYAAFRDRTGDSWNRFVFFTCIVFAFTVGAAVGVPVSRLFGSFSSVVGALIAAVLLISMIIHDKKACVL